MGIYTERLFDPSKDTEISIATHRVLEIGQQRPAAMIEDLHLPVLDHYLEAHALFYHGVALFWQDLYVAAHAESAKQKKGKISTLLRRQNRLDLIEELLSLPLDLIKNESDEAKETELGYLEKQRDLDMREYLDDREKRILLVPYVEWQVDVT